MFLQFPVFHDDLDTFAGQCPEKVIIISVKWNLLSNVSSRLFPNKYRRCILSSRHGLINYKDTKTRCRLYWCLIEFIDWKYSQSCWYFRLSFVNYCPSNLLSGQSTVCGWGVLSNVGEHILQKFNNLYMARFRTYKIARPPKQKPRRGRGLRQINTCRKVPLQVNFLDDDILLWCLNS